MRRAAQRPPRREEGRSEEGRRAAGREEAWMENGGFPVAPVRRPRRPVSGLPMKAVICGAGISGLSAAAFLTRRGWQVVVVEQATGPRPQGYMIDFFGPGWQAADGLGIIPRLRGLGYDVQSVEYVDRRGVSRASLPFARFARVADGQLISILRPDLELAIREVLPPGTDVRYGRSVTTVSEYP